MKKFIFSVLTILTISMTTMSQQVDNPLFKPFTGTSHGTAPFSQLNDSMWMPAIDRGIMLAQQEIDAITSQRSRPDFENTIVALEHVGEDLNRVLNVFYPLMSANSSDAMMDIAVEASRKLSDYSTSLTLNQELWKRVKAVYDDRKLFNLTPEDEMLLQKTYDSFALSGANLQGDDREKYRALSAELSAATTAFGQNVLKEMNTYEIYLTKDDLAGLPESSSLPLPKQPRPKAAKVSISSLSTSLSIVLSSNTLRVPICARRCTGSTTAATHRANTQTSTISRASASSVSRLPNSSAAKPMPTTASNAPWPKIRLQSTTF